MRWLLVSGPFFPNVFLEAGMLRVQRGHLDFNYVVNYDNCRSSSFERRPQLSYRVIALSWTGAASCIHFLIEKIFKGSRKPLGSYSVRFCRILFVQNGIWELPLPGTLTGEVWFPSAFVELKTRWKGLSDFETDKYPWTDKAYLNSMRTLCQGMCPVMKRNASKVEWMISYLTS